MQQNRLPYCNLHRSTVVFKACSLYPVHSMSVIVIRIRTIFIIKWLQRTSYHSYRPQNWHQNAASEYRGETPSFLFQDIALSEMYRTGGWTFIFFIKIEIHWKPRYCIWSGHLLIPDLGTKRQSFAKKTLCNNKNRL